MSVESLRAERIQNIIDATSFKEPKKIPVGAEVISWPFSYAGVRYEDVMDDPQKTFEAYIKYFDVVDFDFVWGGTLNTAVKAAHAMGNYSYRIGDDGTVIIHLQPEIDYMSADDYPDLIADPVAFNNKMFKQRNTTLQLPREQAYPKIIEALKAIGVFKTANDLISDYMSNVKGIVPITGAPIGYFSPINTLFDSLRGMSDTLIDLKRRPDTVREAVKVLGAANRARFASLNPLDFSEPYPLGSTGYHIECFLSPELFDEFFFNEFMELCMPFMEAGLKFFIKGEGRFINTIDRYRKLPKGSCVFMLDQDDPFEIYKAIGDWHTVATGITVDLLQMGTVQQCTDYVKRCFDTFAPGGGFIFMPNKPLLCAEDAKPENLIAVFQTANQLSLQ
ncbi:MAG: hypothetical protein LBG68_01210 [Coriobacteriales bacterium]|jgi:hypothetical protein|nr:hypothetical protein [Coriobacteriales bacterium]